MLGLVPTKSKELGFHTHQGAHEPLGTSAFQQPKGSTLKKVPNAGQQKQSTQGLGDGSSEMVK